MSLPLEIPLVAGWNWIGYPRSDGALLSVGMPTFAFSDGDEVKTKTAFAKYYAGQGWQGTLSTMSPGEGYRLKVATAGTATYQPLSPRRRLASEPPASRKNGPTPSSEDSPDAVPADWHVDHAKFDASMTLTAMVFIGNKAQDRGVLAAFVGDELRGVATASRPLSFGSHTGKCTFDMVIHGNSDVQGEGVAFKFFDGARTMTFVEFVYFTPDASVADAYEPFMMRLPLSGNPYSHYGRRDWFTHEASSESGGDEGTSTLCVDRMPTEWCADRLIQCLSAEVRSSCLSMCGGCTNGTGTDRRRLVAGMATSAAIDAASCLICGDNEDQGTEMGIPVFEVPICSISIPFDVLPQSVSRSFSICGMCCIKMTPKVTDN